MPSRASSFDACWPSTFTWITADKKDKTRAYCKCCCSTFSVANGGIAQVRQHERTPSHKKRYEVIIYIWVQTILLNSILLNAILLNFWVILLKNNSAKWLRVKIQQNCHKTLVILLNSKFFWLDTLSDRGEAEVQAISPQRQIRPWSRVRVYGFREIYITTCHDYSTCQYICACQVCRLNYK